MTDTWMGDDFFHQGAFRLSYGFEYAGSLELSKDMSVPLPIGTWDTYDWYLRARARSSNVDAKYFHGKVPTWNGFVAHPAYDAFWQARAVQRAQRAGGADAQRGRMVGPGGPLRPARDLPGARARRHGEPELPRHGPVESRRLARRRARRMPVVDPGTADGYLRDVEAPWFAY